MYVLLHTVNNKIVNKDINKNLDILQDILHNKLHECVHSGARYTVDYNDLGIYYLRWTYDTSTITNTFQIIKVKT